MLTVLLGGRNRYGGGTSLDELTHSTATKTNLLPIILKGCAVAHVFVVNVSYSELNMYIVICSKFQI